MCRVFACGLPTTLRRPGMTGNPTALSPWWTCAQFRLAPTRCARAPSTSKRLVSMVTASFVLSAVSNDVHPGSDQEWKGFYFILRPLNHNSKSREILDLECFVSSLSLLNTRWIPCWHPFCWCSLWILYLTHFQSWDPVSNAQWILNAASLVSSDPVGFEHNVISVCQPLVLCPWVLNIILFCQETLLVMLSRFWIWRCFCLRNILVMPSGFWIWCCLECLQSVLVMPSGFWIWCFCLQNVLVMQNGFWIWCCLECLQNVLVMPSGFWIWCCFCLQHVLVMQNGFRAWYSVYRASL